MGRWILAGTLIAALCGCKAAAAPPQPVLVDAFAASEPAKRVGQKVQLHGFVVEDTIFAGYLDEEAVTGLLVGYQGAQIPVFLRGPRPDRLRDREEVLAIGTVKRPADLAALAERLGMKLDGATVVVDATEIQVGCLPIETDGVKSPAWCLPLK